MSQRTPLPKRPTKPRKIKSIYVKPRIKFNVVNFGYGPVIPKDDGHRFIKNYNWHLAQMYKKAPETRKSVEKLINDMGFATTKSGLIRYTESTNIKLMDIGYGQEHLNLFSPEGLRKFKEDNERMGDFRPTGIILADRFVVDWYSKKLDYYYIHNLEEGIDEGTTRDILRKYAPDLFTQDRPEGEGRKANKLTYSELREIFETLHEQGLI